MEYLLAAQLSNLASGSVTAESLTKIMDAVEPSAQHKAKIDLLVECLGDKSLDQLIADGNEKMSALATVVAAPAAATAATAGSSAPAADKKEEAKEESASEAESVCFDF
ncbi:MAG: hypothetical protein MHMPM18_001946 [Marteilia pararefringens]